MRKTLIKCQATPGDPGEGLRRPVGRIGVHATGYQLVHPCEVPLRLISCDEDQPVGLPGRNTSGAHGKSGVNDLCDHDLQLVGNRRVSRFAFRRETARGAVNTDAERGRPAAQGMDDSRVVPAACGPYAHVMHPTARPSR